MFLIRWISKVVHFYDHLFLVPFVTRIIYVFLAAVCCMRPWSMESCFPQTEHEFHSYTWFLRVCRVLWFWTFCFLILLHIFSAVMDAELHILNSVSTLVCFRPLVFLYSGLGLGFSPNQKLYLSVTQKRIKTPLLLSETSFMSRAIQMKSLFLMQWAYFLRLFQWLQQCITSQTDLLICEFLYKWVHCTIL